MCRSIRVLRGIVPPAQTEVEEAALQFVRKISGYRKPSKTNTLAFDAAVEEISAASHKLLSSLAATTVTASK